VLKIYAYSGCDTCRKALKFLAARNVPHTVLAIRETPPSKAELKAMLRAQGDLKKLFNVSGQDYRAQGLSEKLPKLSEDEALGLLAANGNLVKRPFAIGQDIHLVGFKEAEWQAAL